MAYKKTAVTPITSVTINTNARKWLNIVRFGESGIVIQPQDDCEYRVPEIINNKKLLIKYLGPYYKKYLLIYVSVDSKEPTSVLKENLIEVCHKRKIFLKTQHSLEELINDVIEKGYEIGFFVGKVRGLIEETNFSSFLKLEHLLEKTSNCSMIIFSETDLTNERYEMLSDKCSLLFDHVLLSPLYGKKDIRQFFKYNNSMWGMKLPAVWEEKIIKDSGGHLWLVSHLQRCFRDNPSFSFERIVKDDLLKDKLRIIWKYFLSAEQDIFKKVFTKQLNDTDQLTHEYNFLCKMGFISSRKEIGIPLLKLIIQQADQLHKFKLINKQIYYLEENLSVQLSKEEDIFLTTLLIDREKIVSREKLAMNLWGKSWEEKYSDWALDRLAYRLRKRLQHFGVDPHLLQTKKRKGFILT